MNTIYFFCNGCAPRWHMALAIADTGLCMGSHLCSDHGFMPWDLLYRKDRKEALDKQFPDGWKAEYVEKPLEHPGLMAAYALNQAMKEPDTDPSCQAVADDEATMAERRELDAQSMPRDPAQGSNVV